MVSERVYVWDTARHTLVGSAMDYNGYSPFFELTLSMNHSEGRAESKCELRANVGKTILQDFPNAISFAPSSWNLPRTQ